jgi:putative YphP/YqiW family bacilliredoxin
MYPEIMVIPMREELTRAGLSEARTAADVDAAVAQPGTTMLVVNSICGCAAGKMRPGVRLAMQHASKPDHAVTVFAGQDREATEKARSYFGGHLPRHRNPARRPVGLPDAALGDRNLHRPGDCPGANARLRYVLRADHCLDLRKHSPKHTLL